MNTEPRKHLASQVSNSPATSESAEPTVGSARPPMWLFVLLGTLFYGSQLYVDGHSGGFHAQVYEPYPSIDYVNDLQVKGDDGGYAKGKLIFEQKGCAACHQNSGLGTPGQFPPLAGSDWVNAPSPNRIIRLVLQGIQGPIKVNGVDFNNVMPPWKGVLTDEEIAAVLTYIRQNKEWGNNSPPVTPAQIKAIDKEVSDRSEPWTAPELMKVPESN